MKPAVGSQLLQFLKFNSVDGIMENHLHTNSNKQKKNSFFLLAYFEMLMQNFCAIAGPLVAGVES